MRQKQPPLKPPLKDEYGRIWLEMYLLSAPFLSSAPGMHTPVTIGCNVRVITLSRELDSRDAFDPKQATIMFHMASCSVKA